MKANDLSNRRFGKLIVLSREPNDKKGNTKWKCICDCGETTIVAGQKLTGGRTRSCGCLRGGSNKASYDTSSPEYRTWQAMKRRCDNKKSEKWDRYGGRGVSVCSRWLDSFEAFLEDMGPKPSDSHSIERIDNDEGYYPDNCKWASTGEQSNNKSSNVYIEYNGMTKTLKQWADYLGESYWAIQKRHKRGCTTKEVLYGKKN